MSPTALQAADRGINTTADHADGLRNTLAQWGPLLLRIALGWGFIMHGWAKFSRGPEGFAVVLHTLGVPVPFLMAWLTTILELVGGFALIVGAFVPLVSIPLAVILLVALFKVHLPYGFFSVKLVEVSAHGTRFGTVGYEIIVMYLGGLAALALGGAGRWSVDHWWNGRRADEDASA